MAQARSQLSNPSPILPDVLAPGLKVWFVGTAAGPKSAAVGAYYAHGGNRFWRALHEAGITPRRLAPHEYPNVLELGVGLTDFCKTDWGIDRGIDRQLFDVASFRRKVARLKPRALAFTSKASAGLWLGQKTSRVAVGRQADEAPGRPIAFVLPSPSGLATSYWSIEPWCELGRWLLAQTG